MDLQKSLLHCPGKLNLSIQVKVKHVEKAVKSVAGIGESSIEGKSIRQHGS